MADKTVEEKLDAIFDSISKRMDATDARLDAACSRMDSMAKKDSEKEEADAKAKKDAEDEKAKKDAADKEATDEKAKKDAAEAEEKAKKDTAEAEEKAAKDAAARIDKAVADRLAAIEAALPAKLTPETRGIFVAAQVKAEPAYLAFGDSAGAPPPLNGESLDNYQRRLLSKFKAHSPRWKDKDLSVVHASVLEIAEEQIYADAAVAATNPANLPGTGLRRIERKDSAGRTVTRYAGDERACWSQFTNAGMTGRFLNPQNPRT